MYKVCLVWSVFDNTYYSFTIQTDRRTCRQKRAAPGALLAHLTVALASLWSEISPRRPRAGRKDTSGSPLSTEAYKFLLLLFSFITRRPLLFKSKKTFQSVFCWNSLRKIKHYTSKIKNTTVKTSHGLSKQASQMFILKPWNLSSE